MCGDGGLRDQNGNEIDLTIVKSQNPGITIITRKGVKLNTYSIKEYLEWTNNKQSLTEEMIEGKKDTL